MRRLVDIFATSLAGTSHTADLAEELQHFICQTFEGFPWPVVITDWTSGSYRAGGNEEHWSGDSFYVQIKTERAGRDILRLDGMRFLERFLEGEVELAGNLYAIASITKHSSLNLKPWHLISQAVKNFVLQNTRRARVNVRSH